MKTIYASPIFFVSQFHGCLEIMDRRTGKELCLTNSLAQAFLEQVHRWEHTQTPAEEIEEVLEGYATLAHYPVRAH